jgi:hypothetical protein
MRRNRRKIQKAEGVGGEEEEREEGGAMGEKVEVGKTTGGF